MGLAATQARILLLTADNNNIEYSIMTISQAKMTLAQQQETAAKEYSNALNNKRLKFEYAMVDGKGVYEDFTYDSLSAENPDYIGEFRVINARGEVVVSSINDIPELKNATTTINDDGTVTSSVTQKNGSYYSEDGRRYVICPDVKKTQYFQNALRNGALIVQQATRSSVTNDDGTTSEYTSWSTKSASALDNVEDQYYTEDDAGAQANYEAKMAMVANKDKLLDLQLKQLETRKKCNDSELESLKKQQEDHAKAFKVFA